MSEIPHDIEAAIKPLKASLANLQELARQVQTPVGVIPFIGSGISYAACGYPVWRTFLLEQAEMSGNRKQVKTLLDGNQYEEAAELARKSLGDVRFQDAVLRRFEERTLPSPLPDNEIVRAVRRLFPKGPIITPNYDYVLQAIFRSEEHAFRNILRGAASDSLLRAIRERDRILGKIHGDAEDPKDRVLTSEEYDREYGPLAAHPAGPLPDLLRELFQSGHPLLFVGCSLEADRMVRVFEAAAAGGHFRHYAILEAAETDAALEAQDRRLHETKIRPIWYPHGEHHWVARILNYLADLVSAKENPAKVGWLAFRVQPEWNPNFTGRKALLSGITESLIAGQRVALSQTIPTGATAQGVAVAGMGGVGKTQLAAEYAYRNAARYEVVWWLRAEGTETLASDYALLASELKLPEAQSQRREDAVDAAKRYLQHASEWLVVFDNAESVKAITPHLPRGNGHVLITTRNPLHDHHAKILAVDTWPRTDSIAFLEKRLDRQDPEFDALAADLGDLPLALEQAAAYMDNVGLTASLYRQRFRVYKLKAFPDSPPEDYHHTVATTWSLAFDKISKPSLREKLRGQKPLASELLSLCAFLAPDEIPYDLLATWPSAPDGTTRDKAIVLLRAYSLVTVGSDSLSIHRLVQLVARERLQAQKANRFLEQAIEQLKAIYHRDISIEVGSWPICERLLPHGFAVLEHLGDRTDLAPDAASILADRMATYLQVRAEFFRAKKLFMRAISIAEATYGPDHPNVAAISNDLGSVLKDLGDLVGAKAAYERALKINEATYGPDHPEVATTVNNLGGVLQDLGDLAGAKAAFERAIKIDVAVYGPRHRDVATEINNLGLVLRDLGDLKGARAEIERALSIDESALGSDHPNVARDINNLGLVLQDLGDRAGAKAAFERALRIDEVAFGPEHPNVAIRLNNLGDVMRTLGNLAGAKAAYERALKINEAVYGPDHPNIEIGLNNLGRILDALGDGGSARTAFERAIKISEAVHENDAIRLNNLGDAMRTLGNLAGAKAAYERALKINEAVYGPDHPNIEIGLNNLGRILFALGDRDSARAAFERVIKISEAIHEPDYPNVAMRLSNLGNMLSDIGDLPSAKAAFERALTICENANGLDHASVARQLRHLGKLLKEMGDYIGARKAFERAIKIDEESYGPDHSEVAILVNELGSLLKVIGDFNGAKAAYERAIKIDEESYGPDHSEVATLVSNLGILLEEIEDFNGAKAAYERAIKIDEAVYGPDHPKVAILVTNLGRILEEMGNSTGARKAYERAIKITEAVSGPDQREVATHANNLGNIRRDLGDLIGAKAAFERAIKVDEAVYGPDHPKVAIFVSNLGGVLRVQGDLAGARKAYQRAIKIGAAIYSPDHPDVAIYFNNLGDVLRAQGDLDGARANFERAYDILRRFLGEDHPNTKAVKRNLESIPPAG